MSALSITSNVAFRATSQSVRGPAPRAFVSPMVPNVQQMRRMRALPGRSVVVSAQKDTDFDSLLTSLADKFEKTEKKPAVIGWTAAAVGAFFLTEWLIHLPLLNVILGFPLQLVGVLSLPWAYLKYVDEGNSIVDDVGSAAKKVTQKLPGLE